MISKTKNQEDGEEGISGLQIDLNSGKSSVEEIIETELKNIGDYNESRNAFITLFDKGSAPISNQIKNLRSKKSKKSRLFGVPFVIKDNIFLAGFRTTAGSGAFQNFVPNTNGDIIDMFLAARAIPLGKTNLHEMAMGATATSSFFGPMRNPRDPSRISGGSSGGSAIAVALAKVPIVGIGSDTGGSVRIPAALCGVCGFKPTFGIFSTAGVFPLSATLDHIGFLTRSMRDMQIAYRSLLPESLTHPREKRRAGKIKIGIPNEYYFVNAEKQAVNAFWRAVDKLEERGSDFLEISKAIEIPDYSRISRVRKTIMIKEGAYYYQDLIQKPELRKLVHPDVLGFFDAGSKVGMMEYMFCSQERISHIERLSKLFRTRVDYLLMPTCLTTAPRIEDVVGKEGGEIRMRLVRNTEPFNLSGFPALSIPTDDGGKLPTGIQVAGNAYTDLNLLDVGENIWNTLHRND